MRVRTTRSGKQTREWILETAIKLFNEYGTQAISTKRIAKEMGISPGNLYYHFKNKEEIIRAIMQDKFTGFAAGTDNAQLPPLKRLLGLINNVLLFWQEYPFSKKELVVMLKHDPELKKLYHANKQDIFQKARPLFQELVQTKALQPQDDPHVFESLLTISWIIGEYWLNFLDINDELPTPANLQKGVSLILQVWRPYFTPKALDELQQLQQP
jgi:AcrR family transcriptional regulator